MRALDGALDMDALFESFSDADPEEPDWRVPNDFYTPEALQLRRKVICDYLEQFPGIGRAVSVAIVEQLGIEKLSQIDEDPKQLLSVDVPGIPEDTLRNLAKDWGKLRKDYQAFEMDQAVAVRLLKMDQRGNLEHCKLWYKGKEDLIPMPEETCPGMEQAGKELLEMIKAGDKIAVFCDYDVDGTTAGEVFRLGSKPYSPRLSYEWASAENGFGLTEEFVRSAAKRGCKGLVTLDCGSTQSREVALAQSLGMKVWVVDHHDADPENPADFHLNPQLQKPRSSENTGAQLSWKLMAALQLAADGEVRAEHSGRALQLAGMGCLADMGPVALPENRAFFWAAHEEAPPGVRALAEALEEDIDTPGHYIKTQAALNLPKRTSRLSARDVSRLLSARTPGEAAPLVEKIRSEYERASDARKVMTDQALEHTGEAVWLNNGDVRRPDPDHRIASYVFQEDVEYPGYTGPVASRVASSTRKPAVVFAKRGEDADGNPIYKFSSRNSASVRHPLGELLRDSAMQEACTVREENAEGEVVEGPSLGGHEQVVSGSCSEENIPRVVEAMEAWAERKDSQKSFYWGAWTGPDAKLDERKVSPERLEDLESQAARLGPFSDQKSLARPRVRGREDVMMKNQPLKISVYGTLQGLEPDPENPSFLAGSLDLGDGVAREARFPADEADCPEGENVEWILQVGKPGAYYLRKFARTDPNK